LKQIHLVFLFLLIVTVFGGCSWDRPVRSVSGTPVGPGDSMVTLTAVGDVVMHLPVVYSAYNPGDGSFDFRPVFQEIKDSLSSADLAVGVLETQLAGLGSKYTGYPRFNSPASIADAMQWAGIELVFTAHNHSLDQGAGGLLKTLGYLDQIRLLHTGCRSDSGSKRYQLVDLKGIKLAFLSYTTTTNGIPLPSGREWMVNFLDFQKIKADITEAKLAGANGIVMALHTGTEYAREPSPEQQMICDRLIELGVDIILGSHVHVIEPLEPRLVPDSGLPGKNRTCFIVYSLGNLLSNQRWRYSDCGLMVTFKLRKGAGEPGIRIVEVRHAPLWVRVVQEPGRASYRIKKLAGPEYDGHEPGIEAADRSRMREVWDDTEELFGKWFTRRMLEKTAVFNN
jgi:poly-gamma-glutamate capsule biosynthesis protein CapA/YwtB (metallophosphatase superfamily)